jgi:hypothetical protein
LWYVSYASRQIPSLLDALLILGFLVPAGRAKAGKPKKQKPDGQSGVFYKFQTANNFRMAEKDFQVGELYHVLDNQKWFHAGSLGSDAATP